MSKKAVGKPRKLLRPFEQLNEIGAALSSEKDIHLLLEKILVGARTITNADGGTLYLMSEDGRSLRFEIVANSSLNIAMGGSSGNPVPYPDLPLIMADGSPNNAMVATYCAIHRKTVNIPDAYGKSNFDFSGMRGLDGITGYHSKSLLAVPLTNQDSEVIGVLQLINALDRNTGEVVRFSRAAQRLAESLGSQAAIVLSNRRLILQQEALFESFIRMINLAIDAKSPYTAGHCQRVPTLTMMLAEAAQATVEGPFASFSMTEQDRHELQIAGLLHDCGKITTPVHVVDKATKLETIFDRIALIDTRFEVLKRDAEIEALKATLALRSPVDPAAEAVLESTLRRETLELDAEREFLRRANIGAEKMRPEDQRTVRDIGTRRQWINPQGLVANFLSADETENLTIRAGTLTPAERRIIDDHIVVTIRMLESLPWVRHLKNVPEYAGGHHERMDGKGFPRGLEGHQMSVQSRILGIADIFEALTAEDRPYKQGKLLSESLNILGNFSLNGHIDPDLFDVFVRNKIYLQYALQFLKAGQIDAVDESNIAGYTP
ncbi:MAG: HD domain-containing phosphohydrolase [Pseudomonadota bacterium]